MHQKIFICLVMFNPRDTVSWNHSPLSVRTNPQFRMNLVFGDNFTSQDVAH
jgi:hypothetical protein